MPNTKIKIKVSTLLEALKEGAFYKDKDGKIKFEICLSAEYSCDEKLQLYGPDYRCYFLVEDYGKTWALTREELE